MRFIKRQVLDRDWRLGFKAAMAGQAFVIPGTSDPLLFRTGYIAGAKARARAHRRRTRRPATVH